MAIKKLLGLFFGIALFCTFCPLSLGQGNPTKQPKAAAPQTSTASSSPQSPSLNSADPNFSDRGLFVDIGVLRGLKKPAAAGPRNNASTTDNAFQKVLVLAPQADPPPAGSLPVWTFRVRSPRDGNYYSGTMVGTNPFQSPGAVNVPTIVVPLVIHTKEIVTGFDVKTGILSTVPGDNTVDPTVPDNTCLSSPNNVPEILVQQSPIFTPTKFALGGTNVGTTEYNDAFQRANFWKALEEQEDARNTYHVLLNPTFTAAIFLDVPDVYGVALTDGLVLGPPAFCAPVTILDINWFDTYLTGTVIPNLQSQGLVNPGRFPVFLVYNTVWASPANNLYTCCALGYHSITGFPLPTQTYSPSDFDTSGFFSDAKGNPLPGFHDSAILSHEVDEWMNDPYIVNPTSPWGHTGQVSGFCQANLEVGDPLTGTTLPPIIMPNGYTYNLQELAFFSWFFGGRSFGVNGWYSDNGTFTKDAGAPCH